MTRYCSATGNATESTLPAETCLLSSFLTRTAAFTYMNGEGVAWSGGILNLTAVQQSPDPSFSPDLPSESPSPSPVEDSPSPSPEEASPSPIEPSDSPNPSPVEESPSPAGESPAPSGSSPAPSGDCPDGKQLSSSHRKQRCCDMRLRV